ncbi:hypothetical protein CCHR01_14249 [Colletotrichum chrysophilum]|uniref:Uncharacterized protein n=1 Tax=Colletotrichum chrysophilum TaxID=1836956 RepID=A0AAD9EFP4_9PEZI|nr:hypothetical protein CCHR01_14249 [Colletotrichum chrysophilum]
MSRLRKVSKCFSWELESIDFRRVSFSRTHGFCAYASNHGQCSRYLMDENDSHRFWGRRLNIEFGALHGFVDTLLKSPKNLRLLQLNFDSLVHDIDTRRWVLQPAITSRKASHPCRMDLLHMSLDSEKMDAFLGDGPLFLTLGAPVMIRGTWKEALRIMRQNFKHDDLNLEMRRRSGFPLCMRGLQGLVVGGIQYAEGAECMDEDEYANALGSWEGLGDDSHALDYVNHNREDNPFSGHS